MTPEAEIVGGVKILQGPPIPAILPCKGVGVFLEDGKMRYFVLSKFNNSDTLVRSPVSFASATKLFWNLVWNR